MPRDDQGLIKRVLEALAFRFDDEKVLVDQTVFNPARIWKLYGTVARKGDSTMDRPHRLARILDAPARLAVVDAALLAELASSAPNDEKTSRVGAGVGDRFDLREWIARHGLDVIGPAPWRGGERWIFRVCPWNADHRGREWSACACRGDPAPPSRVRRHRGQDIEGPQGR